MHELYSWPVFNTFKATARRLLNFLAAYVITFSKLPTLRSSFRKIHFQSVFGNRHQTPADMVTSPICSKCWFYFKLGRLDFFWLPTQWTILSLSPEIYHAPRQLHQIVAIIFLSNHLPYISNLFIPVFQPPCIYCGW